MVLVCVCYCPAATRRIPLAPRPYEMYGQAKWFLYFYRLVSNYCYKAIIGNIGNRAQAKTHNHIQTVNRRTDFVGPTSAYKTIYVAHKV